MAYSPCLLFFIPRTKWFWKCFGRRKHPELLTFRSFASCKYPKLLWFGCTLVLLLFVRPALGQQADSLSEQAESPGFFYRAADYPRPGKALLYGLVFPGGGQIYNKKWWKLPLVYGGLGAMGWAIRYNTKNYLNFKRNYRRAVRGLPHDYDELNLSESFLKSVRDKADKRRQLSYVGFVAVYALSLADAFVDAHLAGYEIDEDLSLQLRLVPVLERDAFGGGVQGFGLSLQF